MTPIAGFSGARICGAYTTAQVRDAQGRTGTDFAIDAIRGALDDAGLTIRDVDGIASFVPGWPVGLRDGPRVIDEYFWAKQMGAMSWTSANIGIPTLMDAAAAITNGLASTIVLVVGSAREAQAGATASWTRRDYEFTGWTGSYTAVQYALAAKRYMHEYGSRALDAMAEAAAVIRNYGSINPDAVYAGRGPYTREDILTSPQIASPLTRLMCSSVNDGGAAVVITTKERARDLQRTPVQVVTGALRMPYPPYCDVPALSPAHTEASQFARKALARSGVRHEDIDVVSLYDHFASGLMQEFEMYGFCDLGEATDLVLSGAMRLDGRFPTCTDGGNLSFSHNGLPFMFRIIEAVRQLRNEVPDACPRWRDGIHTHVPGTCRAVRDAKVAFVANPGPPTGGGSMMVISGES